jgi:hypothetical protein
MFFIKFQCFEHANRIGKHILVMKGGGLIKKDVSRKLCFGVDGAFVFQGIK